MFGAASPASLAFIVSLSAWPWITRGPAISLSVPALVGASVETLKVSPPDPPVTVVVVVLAVP